MSKIGNEVVVRFRDGSVTKGYTYDFNSNRDFFHVAELNGNKRTTEVSVLLLKAIFFVKTFEGNKAHRTFEDFTRESLKNTPGLKVKVTFSDGEVMYGSTHGYAPNRKGFFIFPANKDSNNERVFIVRESTSEVETWG
jgi:hypothetical protein